MESSLLFSLHGQSGSIRKSKNGKDSYTIKIKDASDRVTWFTDMPDRQAGSESVQEFIDSWETGFPDGVNPNAALEFDDKQGNSDVVVFEMDRPVYSAKRDTLKFRAKINDDQVLDGALESYSVLADDEFAKNFSSASLFIDNWVLKDTQVTITNHFSEDVVLRPILFEKDGKTVANYIYNALGGLAGFVGTAAELLLVGPEGIASAVGEGLVAAAEGVGLGTIGQAVVTFGGLALVGIAGGVAVADAIQTKYHTVVDDSLTPTTIPAGGNFAVKDSESRWGFHNGVTDIAFLVTTKPKVDPVTGIKSAGIIGSVFFDNPTVGPTYAKIYPWDGTRDPVPASANDVDRIVLGTGTSRDIGFEGGHMTVGYEGESGFLFAGSKNWTLDLFAN